MTSSLNTPLQLVDLVPLRRALVAAVVELDQSRLCAEFLRAKSAHHPAYETGRNPGSDHVVRKTSSTDMGRAPWVFGL